jgi:para-nitrobenzyl esterase
MSEVVETRAGTVRGVERDGVVAFKGISYGDDTSGEGRFRPPRPPLAWAAVRDCLEYGPSCPQVTVAQMTGQELPAEVETFMGIWNHERQTGEDCLVLNVWTPAVDDGASRPVLVWLHGGGMAVGSASWPLYDFTNVARNNDVVVVGVNHRLGVLGFLDVSHLGDEFTDSGNVGMLDIVAALEWVRDNITQFGGDPANVTIFGESGGGSKVTCLLGMPSAQGLSRSAFAMSGALLAAQMPEAARANTDAVLEHLGVGTDVEALGKLDADAIVQASVAISGSGLAAARAGFGPTLGPSLPEHPVDAVRAGSGSDVNVVLGCTTHEMVAFMGTPELFASGEVTVREMLRGMLGDNADAIFDGYRAANPDDSPPSLFVLIASDNAMRIPHIRYAEALLDGGATNPRMYLFDFRRPGLDGVERAGHGSDMPFFFDNLDKAPASDGAHAAPLVSATSGALVALAKTGDRITTRSRRGRCTRSATERRWSSTSSTTRCRRRDASGTTAGSQGRVGSAAMTTAVTIVTGAASGMGLATARRLLRPRETMLLVDLDAAKLEAVRADLAEYAAGPEWVETAVADVTDTDAMARLAETVRDLGPFRTLAHAAGISPTMGEWWPMVHVDLVGTARILQALLPLVEPGSVAVCWASNSAHMGATPAGDPVLDPILDDPLDPDLHARLEAALEGRWDGEAGSGAAYGWAKRGVIRLVRREASAWGARGGRLLSVSPGIINTPMSRQELEKQPMMQVMLDNTPVPRMGAPSEVADLVAFLVSHNASYLTGTDILIDGGVSATLERMLNPS